MDEAPKDQRKFEWHILPVTYDFRQATINQLKFTLPLLIALIGASYWMSANQIYMNFTTLLIFFVGLSILIVIGINWGWYYIRSKAPPQVSNGTLTAESIIFDSQTWPLTSLTNATSEIESNRLPANEWRKPRPPQGQLIYLQLSSNQGDIILPFHEEFIKQKFLQMLSEFVKQQ